MALMWRQIFGRFGGYFQEGVPRRAGHVILDLRDQGRDKIESLMDVRKLIQQFDHAVVVLEGMQPYPGQAGTRR